MEKKKCLMRAKTVNENVNFERGQDPKKAMGIGYNDVEGYVNAKLKGMFPNKDLDSVESSFWNMVADSYQDMKGYEIHEMILTVLKNTPLKYQMEWMEGDLEEFETGVEEGYINI